LRDHLEAYKALTGRAHPLLRGPALPPAGETLWRWFLELRAGLAPEAPLSHAELAAWAGLTGEKPAPWEVRELRALDRLWLRSRA
jgi:hypothetical protein